MKNPVCLYTIDVEHNHVSHIFAIESAATRKSKPGEQSETVSKTIPLENEEFNLCVQSCRPYVIQL